MVPVERAPLGRRERTERRVVSCARAVMLRRQNGLLEMYTLLRSKRSKRFAHHWSLPGGKMSRVDSKEAVDGNRALEALRREVEQETGVDISKLEEGDVVWTHLDTRTLRPQQKGGKKLLHVFKDYIFAVNGEGLMPQNADRKEHTDGRWIRVSDFVAQGRMLPVTPSTANVIEKIESARTFDEAVALLIGREKTSTLN